jgi:tetratricopeptide (TPR) repeat protein
VLLVAGSLVLAVLLFIAPRTSASPDGNREAGALKKENPAEADLSVYVNMASKTLEPSRKSQFDRLEGSSRFDSLAGFWQSLRRPDLAAYYAEKSLTKADSAASWIDAGNRYYYAVQFCEDRSEVPALYASAERCFRKALSIDDGNIDARIMLASCMVEGSGDPMEGIAMLREVEKSDSVNLKLQLTFAAFSMKSGQLPKAAERFRKALRADSSYIETYLHLADVYEQMGETDASINTLERFLAATSDPATKAEVRKYIEQLRKKK